MCSPSWFGKNRKLVGHTKSTLKTQRESKIWSCARELKGLPLGTYLSQQGFTSWTALPAGRWVFSGVNQATGNFFTLSRQPINTSFRRVVAIPVPDLLYQVVKLHRSDFRTTTQIMSRLEKTICTLPVTVQPQKMTRQRDITHSLPPKHETVQLMGTEKYFKIMLAQNSWVGEDLSTCLISRPRSIKTS